ncbi:MAG: type II toxin-antitoxin system YafQ family toxin [Aeriscardovia sp.]|nr:type II toxin-antitoxin system YafQ family toxin [Aeriscardovia sp.]
MIKRSLDTSPLDEAVYELENGIPLEAAGKDHALKGEFNGLRECHVRPD